MNETSQKDIFDPKFKTMSTGSRFFYCFLKNKLSNEIKNGTAQKDENGIPFTTYRIRDAGEDFDISPMTASTYLNLLREGGFIKTERQRCKPQRIYILNFAKGQR